MNEFKDIVLKKLKAEDYDWFGQLYDTQFECYDDYHENEPEYAKLKSYHDLFHANRDRYKIIYYDNRGDGHLQTVVFQFSFNDETSILVQVEGYYSSYSDNEWEDVFEAEPYKFEEIRYQRKKNVN